MNATTPTRFVHPPICLSGLERIRLSEAARVNAAVAPSFSTLQESKELWVKLAIQHSINETVVGWSIDVTNLIMRYAEPSMQESKEQYQYFTNTQHSPLLAAICEGKEETVQTLIDAKKADLDQEGYRAFVVAFKQGRSKILEQLIEAGVNVYPQENDWLLLAVKSGRVDLVMAISKIPTVDVNKKDVFGCTVIIQAIKNGSLAIVQYLIENGADVEDSPLLTAEYNPLMLAVQHNRIEITDLLIKSMRQRNLDSQSGWGNTALMLAASFGHKEIAQLLIDAGANVHLGDLHRTNALMLAAKSGKKEIVEMLIKAGADVHAKNIRRDIALLLAIDAGHENVVLSLLPITHVDLINERDEHGVTMLLIAARKKSEIIVKMMVHIVAGLEIPPLDGNSDEIPFLRRCIEEQRNLLIPTLLAIDPNMLREMGALIADYALAPLKG